MSKDAKRKWLKRLHLSLLILWIVMIPVAVVTGWLYSIAFISACSIYANAASHWSAYEGVRAEEQAAS